LIEICDIYTHQGSRVHRRTVAFFAKENVALMTQNNEYRAQLASMTAQLALVTEQRDQARAGLQAAKLKPTAESLEQMRVKMFELHAEKKRLNDELEARRSELAEWEKKLDEQQVGQINKSNKLNKHLVIQEKVKCAENEINAKWIALHEKQFGGTYHGSPNGGARQRMPLLSALSYTENVANNNNNIDSTPLDLDSTTLSHAAQEELANNNTSDGSHEGMMNIC
jgi:hypothetical protein